LVVLSVAVTAALLGADSAAPRTQEPLVATPRLYVGFLDDVAFRWRDDRGHNLDRARRGGATVIRTIVNWRFVAPHRPSDPTDPFAREYRLKDVDELVRNAERRGLEVLLTVWGTPGWANGGKRQNVAPTDRREFRYFTQALASRYSGRHPGYPFVRFYSIWNEPNAEVFLSPQFDSRGRSVAPVTYAALVAAGYAGITSASPRALVAAGETAARGADRPKTRVQDSHSPARFARLVAKATPGLQFDAWAHHPYARNDRTRPGADQRWPHVGFSGLGRFDAALSRWFGGRAVPLWLTELAYRTSPEIVGGAPYPLQAKYLRRAVALARAEPGVAMLVWFMFRDEPGEPWQSGLFDQFGRAKPSFASFVDAAAAGNGDLQITTTAGTHSHELRIPALELRSQLPAGTVVDVRYVLWSCEDFVAAGTTSEKMGADGWVPVSAAFKLAPGQRYRLALVIESRGGTVHRQVKLRPPGADAPPCPVPVPGPGLGRQGRDALTGRP
jgi:hypothetical protein